MNANVTLNSKLEISVPELKFVEHLVSSDGVQIDPQKLSAIIRMKAPPNVAEKDAIAKERQPSDYNKNHRVQTLLARSERKCVGA